MMKWFGIFLLMMVASTTFGQTTEHRIYYDKENSQIKEIIHIKQPGNQLHGSYQMFHQNGRCGIEGVYKEGKADSLWNYYYESGSLKSTGYFTYGKADSIWTYYYENGNVKSSGYIVNGKLNGHWVSYYENNRIKNEGDYNLGIMSGRWTYYYEMGPIKATTIYSDELGDHKEFYASGRLKAEGKKNQHLSTGNWIYYYESGSIQSSGSYQNSLKEGTWEVFYPSSNLKAVGTYHEGKKTGEWKYFHQSGEPLGSGEMIDGQMNGDWKMYFPNGSIKRSGHYTVGTGQVKEYYSNGQVSVNGYLLGGKRDSLWSYFDTQGNLIGQAAYKEGNGEYEGYYPNGKLRISGFLDDDKRVGEWKMYNSDGEFTGTYHPIYESNAIDNPKKSNNKRDSTNINDAAISEYKFKRKDIRFFRPIINEMDGWIFATNPFAMILDHLPVSIENYKQERLGHELQYRWNRDPFMVSDENINLNQVFLRGHSIYLRQKFYSREQPYGMIYLSHHLFGTINKQKIRTQEQGGFRELLMSEAQETLYGYGLTLGWRWMLDAGETGLTFDSYLGTTIARRTWEITKTEDITAVPILSDQDQEPLFFPLSFGINIGWATELKSRRRR
jgi:antitoxin component YwqK of YwqJK toxin-antitoxin module